MLLLRAKHAATIPIEADGIAPDRLAGLSTAAVAALPVLHGNRLVPLGELFAVAGDAADGQVVIEGDCSRVKRIGADMTAGTIAIHGNAGMHLGADMRGGAIHVHGDTGDWTGAEMRGGAIHVHGNAGHLAGAGYRGTRHGMRGGVLLIDGNAGNEVGSTMRRGLIAIGGDSGDYTGVNLIAGTICVFGRAGARVGANMKRGTIVLLGPAPMLLPTFRFACDYRPVFPRLLLRRLAAYGFGPAGEPDAGDYRRYSGDLAALGKGELLCRQS